MTDKMKRIMQTEKQLRTLGRGTTHLFKDERPKADKVWSGYLSDLHGLKEKEHR